LDKQPKFFKKRGPFKGTSLQKNGKSRRLDLEDSSTAKKQTTKRDRRAVGTKTTGGWGKS